jgi:cell division ATPase FtsA
MHMGFLSHIFSKGSGERVLVLHIGSGSVAGAHVSIHAGVTTVLSTVSVDIAVSEDIESVDFEKEMQKALKAVLKATAHANLGAPDRVAVYLASPWYAAQVRVARMSRETAFVASRSLLNDMIARELKAFEEEELGKSHAAGLTLRAIESKTVQVKLNGYPTPDPLDLSARDLELSIFLSVSPEKTLKGIEAIVEKECKAKLSFATFLSASFIVTRDFFPHQDDYLLIDVGGEITDVTLVRGGALIRSVSFPRGRNFLLRKLAKGLKRTIPESIAICTLYREDKVEESIKNACTDILKEAKDEWLDSFQKALFTDSNELSVPDTVMLSVGSDIAPWFIETIRREEFHQHALSDKEFKIVLLDAQAFHESLAFADAVERNPFIMIDALAAAR